MKVLTFMIDKQKYGVSIESVVTVEKNNRKITPIPNSNPYIVGVVNVRSKICPVIDLKKIFSGSENTLEEDKELILFDLNDKSGAMLIDESDNIVDVNPDNIEDFDSGSKKTKVVNQDNEIFPLVEIEDFDELFS